MSRKPSSYPSQELKELITKYGKSERHLTSFNGANITFNPDEHIRSDFEDDTLNLLREFIEKDPEYTKLVAYLSHSDRVSHVYNFEDYFGLKGVNAYIWADRGDKTFNLTFTFPLVNAAAFATDVAILSRIATFWGTVARMPVTEVRVFIHYAYLQWEVMEEEELLYTEYESN